MSEIRSFVHCRRCAEGQQTQRLEVGLTGEGLRVQCKKHGLVAEFSLGTLADLLAHPPGCECCQRLKELS